MNLSRRQLFERGLGGIALSWLLARENRAFANTPTGQPHFSPKAKHVIWLFMNGGVSHLETFDPKPELQKHAGKSIGDSPFKSVQDPERLKLARVVVKNDANGQQRNLLYAPQVGFKQHGENGAWVSDWLPNLAKHVDDLAILRSMYTTDDNHGAQTQFHSGRHMLDGEFPTLGGWVHYGLGSSNDDLPSFVSMGAREYWNKRDGFYLGPAHDAVPLRIDQNNPLDYAQPEIERKPRERAISFETARKLNELRRAAYPGDAALNARIRAYELAYRMQTSIPEVVSIQNEPSHVQRRYGIDRPETKEFGMQLLVARRLVERGVRFVQIQHGAGGAGAWDAHSALVTNHTNNCRAVDQPIAGLLADLKERGLLDETIVVFGTEFGRTPGSQNGDGRDHHVYGFSVWMAGGGLKRGIVHGATDEIGFHAVEKPHYVTDVHATIMKLLGLDPRRLEVPGHKRLEIDFGHPIDEIIS